MRLSVVIFSAGILTASLAVTGFWGVNRYEKWEQQRDQQWNYLNTLDRAFDELAENSRSHQSIDVLTADIRDMGRLSGRRREARAELAWTLQHKPFFLPLTGAERDVLNTVQPQTPKHTPRSNPTPQTQAAVVERASPTPMPSITLTQPVMIHVNNREITLPVGTKLPIYSQSTSYVRILYFNELHDIPVSSTDLKK
jgi:hypothetical protein